MNEADRNTMTTAPTAAAELEADSSYTIGTLNKTDYLTLLEELEHR